MSEEILKALMQLFAIIARQDGGLLENHEKYVFDFLSSQLNLDRVQEYLGIYNEFLKDTKSSENPENADSKRTSVKDSVRTLAICKKINKTLTQRQKFIVLTRLMEFFRNDRQQSVNRLAIVETVADVFNITRHDFGDIRNFVFESINTDSEHELVIGGEQFEHAHTCKHFMAHHHLQGICRFLYIRSINLILLKYQGDSEIYLNGMVIKPQNIYLFPPGSTLRLATGTLYFSSIISRFLHETDTEDFSFYAHIEKHQFPNGTVALRELKIAETSGNLVGIMGASGSGKTTLLTLLSGLDTPTQGEILINGKSLEKDAKELEGVIGFVPQDDLLIEDLTVYQNLYFNAHLCFKGMGDNEIALKISRVLVALGLEEIKHVKVGTPLNKKISGGQRKRLNIALELIREPAVLFLDEPTSGLSSRDSENVMDLLKELTFKGKLVFVVIHQPSSDIFKMFDKLMILDTGGYPAYYGNPVEAVMYFKQVTNQINSEVGECYACGSVNPETIFNLIELKEIDEYGNYTSQRKIKPMQYYERYKEKFLNAAVNNPVTHAIKKLHQIPTKLTQTAVFFKRDLLSKLANRQYILINLLEVPALALFLSLLIRYINKGKSDGYTYMHNDNIPAFFFMAIISALLVGLTVSAEEIYKDQKILKRERFLHLSRLSYLVSKVSLLFILSLIQTVLFTAIGFLILGISDNVLHFGLMLFSVFCFANLFGLILSSTFNSPVTIYIIVPLIIIPQMILGGAMFNFSKLNEWMGGGYKVPAVSNVMVSKWAYEGIAVDMFVNSSFERNKYNYDKLESQLNYKLVYLLPRMEDIVRQSDSAHKAMSPAMEKAIRNELSLQFQQAQKMGLDYSAETMKSNSLHQQVKILKEFSNGKFNRIQELKEKEEAGLVKAAGGQEAYELRKKKHYNKHLEEVVTNDLEKDKILFGEDGIIQVIDPIYQDPVGNKTLTLSAPLFIPYKYLFGMQVSTYYFNLIVIWVINLLTVVVLYFDLLKKLLSRTNRRSDRK